MITTGYILLGLSLFTVYFIFDGYGRLLTLLARGRGETAYARATDAPLPRVTVIIPAYNEEDEIRQKIDNLLAQDYPTDRLQVLVVDDGSSDTTTDIVESMIADGAPLTLVRTPGRYGKTRAQNMAAEHATGDVIVLTDCGSHLDPGALENLVRPLSQEEVGCTTAQLYFRTNSESGVSQAQGFYWNYELKLRQLQSKLGTLATATGSLMAVRRALWEDLDPAFGDDCVIPLNVVDRGFKVVHVKNAVTWDENYSTGASEYRARVRMAMRNWGGTFHKASVLNPFRHGATAWSLIAHKVLRYLTPVFLVGAFAGALLVALGGGSTVPLVLAVIGVIIAAFAAVTTLQERQIPVIRLLGTFILVNLAFAQGVLRSTFGGRIRVYEKADQPGTN